MLQEPLARPGHNTIMQFLSDLLLLLSKMFYWIEFSDVIFFHLIYKRNQHTSWALKPKILCHLVPKIDKSSINSTK